MISAITTCKQTVYFKEIHTNDVSMQVVADDNDFKRPPEMRGISSVKQTAYIKDRTYDVNDIALQVVSKAKFKRKPTVAGIQSAKQTVYIKDNTFDLNDVSMQIVSKAKFRRKPTVTGINFTKQTAYIKDITFKTNDVFLQIVSEAVIVKRPEVLGYTIAKQTAFIKEKETKLNDLSMQVISIDDSFEKKADIKVTTLVKQTVMLAPMEVFDRNFAMSIMSRMPVITPVNDIGLDIISGYSINENANKVCIEVLSDGRDKVPSYTQYVSWFTVTD